MSLNELPSSSMSIVRSVSLSSGVSGRSCLGTIPLVSAGGSGIGSSVGPVEVGVCDGAENGDRLLGSRPTSLPLLVRLVGLALRFSLLFSFELSSIITDTRRELSL